MQVEFQSRYMRAILDNTNQDGHYLTLIDANVQDYPFYFSVYQTVLFIESLEKLRLFLDNDKDTQGLIFMDHVFIDGPRKITLKCSRENSSLAIVVWQDYWNADKKKWIRGFTSQDSPEARVKMVRILSKEEFENFLHYLLFYCYNIHSKM